MAPSAWSAATVSKKAGTNSIFTRTRRTSFYSANGWRPGWRVYTPLFQGKSEKIATDTNDIGLECQGNTLTPFINGVQMRRWQEQKFGLLSGQVGLSASSFQDIPFTIAFDWVKVSEP